MITIEFPISFVSRNTEIIIRYRKGENGAVLAKDYGISRQRIHEIVQRAGVARRRMPKGANAKLPHCIARKANDINSFCPNPATQKGLCNFHAVRRRQSIPDSQPYGRRIKPIEHGTMNGYAHYKCRCDLCSAVAKAYHHAQYLRRRNPNSRRYPLQRKGKK